MTDSSTRLAGRTFRFNWGITLFTLVLFPFLISLGMWQLEREQAKIAAQQQYEQRSQSTAIDQAAVNWGEPDLGWTPISAEGRFDPAHQYLLDNRVLDSKVGYEVLTPFRTDTHVLLVNRGWIAQGVSRSQLPEAAVSTDVLRISGHIYVPEGETLVLAADNLSEGNWPKLIQRVDIERIAQDLGLEMSAELRPYTVRLDSYSAGVLETNWSAINMRPETHRAYAVQWFTMATVLLILYLIFSFRRPEN